MTDARPADSTTPLATGDDLAETGNWPAAIEAWHRAAGDHLELRPAVERRLEWFLAQAGLAADVRSRILPIGLAFLVTTVLGAAFLVFAGEPGSIDAGLWAIAAWVMIAAAVVTSLLAARRSGEAPLGDLVDRARQAAEHIDRDTAPGEM